MNIYNLIQSTFLVENGIEPEILKHIRGIINSPLILSLGAFALVAVLLILVGFCIVRKVWRVQWKDILDDKNSDNKDSRKFPRPIQINNEYELNLN